MSKLTAPSFVSPENTTFVMPNKPNQNKWFTSHTTCATYSYAHFGNGAFGVNGQSITRAKWPQIQKDLGLFYFPK